MGEYLDHGTGELLDPQQRREYEEYRQRPFNRCKLGGKADKLVRIVDAAENRAYTARFPEKVEEQLNRARRLRRKIRARGKGGEDEAEEGETAASSASSRKRPTAKRKLVAAQPEDRPPPEHETKEASDRPPPQHETGEISQSETPQDWGGSETEENQPEVHQSPEDSDEGGQGQVRDQWPWGPAGRPSDAGQSSGLLALRPAEPTGGPPHHLQRQHLPDCPSELGEEPTTRPREPVDLQPNERWHAVYRIQARMKTHAQSGERSE